MNPIPEALTRGKPVTVRPFEQPEYEVLRDYTLEASISSCIYINVGDKVVYIEDSPEELILHVWEDGALDEYLHAASIPNA